MHAAACPATQELRTTACSDRSSIEARTAPVSVWDWRSAGGAWKRTTVGSMHAVCPAKAASSPWICHALPPNRQRSPLPLSREREPGAIAELRSDLFLQKGGNDFLSLREHASTPPGHQVDPGAGFQVFGEGLLHPPHQGGVVETDVVLLVV